MNINVIGLANQNLAAVSNSVPPLLPPTPPPPSPLRRLQPWFLRRTKYPYLDGSEKGSRAGALVWELPFNALHQVFLEDRIESCTSFNACFYRLQQKPKVSQKSKSREGSQVDWLRAKASQKASKQASKQKQTNKQTDRRLNRNKIKDGKTNGWLDRWINWHAKLHNKRLTLTEQSCFSSPSWISPETRLREGRRAKVIEPFTSLDCV